MRAGFPVMKSSKKPLILDERGNPIMAYTSNYAADQRSAELVGWNPPYLGADAEWLPEQAIVMGRVHDQVRNNGMINGAIQTQIDNWVGAGLRLSAKPNWEALGIDDPDVQAAWEDKTEAKFNEWANDPDCYCDAARQLTFGGMIAQACRTFLINFEIVALAEWLNRPGAMFRTALQMIDPMRLSNPDGKPDSVQCRGGIEFGKLGEPMSYYIASRLPNDLYSVDRTMLTWREVPRETTWGRRVVIHIFDQERPGQSRGKGGLISVLARGRMLDRNEKAHLQAAIQNAMFASFVTSPMDWQNIGQALGSADGEGGIKDYLEGRLEFHKDQYIMFGDTRIPHMFPGEKIEHLQATHPHANFDSFERVFQRYMASGMNMTYEQFSRDYSQTNYSGHRAALLDYWRFVTGRRSNTAGKFAAYGYALWLEEAMENGTVETLPGAPSFLEAKSAWSGCKWIGPGRGQIDPQKEAEAAKVEDSMGYTTDEIQCAERGLDWREVQEQRAQEAQNRKRLAKKYGIDVTELKAPGTPAVKPPPEAPEEPRPAQPAKETPQ